MAYLLRSLFAKRSPLTSAFSISYTTASVFHTQYRRVLPMAVTRREYAKASGRYPSNDTLVLPGCDFEHWLVTVASIYSENTREEIVKSYVNILSRAMKSTEEEARVKIYSVSTRHYYAFGAIMTEEHHIKTLMGMAEVLWVLPDSYVNSEKKDYGGEPFINGEVVPYDPKYHDTWVRIRKEG